jgi:hypothetical protein
VILERQLIPLLIQIQQQVKKNLAPLTQVAAEAETSKEEGLTAPEVLELISAVILTFSKLLNCSDIHICCNFGEMV